MNDLTLWEQEYKKLEPYNTPRPINDLTDTWRRDVIARKRVELWRMQQQYGATAAPCQRLGLRIDQVVRQDLDLPDAWEDNHDAATEQLIASLPAENPYKEGSVEYRLVELAQGKMATGSEGMRDGSRRQAASQRVVDRIIEDIELHKALGTFDDWAAETLEQMEQTYGAEVAPAPYRVPPALIRMVRGYYQANRNKPTKGINWWRVLIAFGAETSTAHLPYTAAEARESEKIWSGWAPVREALEKLEADSAPDIPTLAEAAPETGQAHDNQPLVAPAHKLRFLKWLQVEREMAAKINGAGHPVVKRDVFGKLIEYVEQDVPDNRGDLQVQYDNFKSWLNGDVAQEQPDGSMKMGDETELTPEEKAYKAEQDAYAAEVAEFQKWRDETGSKMKFDDWKWQKTNTTFSYNGVYVTDKRNGCSINYDKVSQRRYELTPENVRYRLSKPPNGAPIISWLALNYEGCLCHLPNNTETETRMVPAEEVRQLIIDGYNVLTQEQYAYNQRVMHSRADKFAAFNLFVQTAPDGRYLGVCPTQGDPSGPWTVDRALFDAIKGDSSQARTVVAPDDIADAIERGDWASVARLAERELNSVRRKT